MALKVKISKLGFPDIIKFVKMPKVREAHIMATEAKELPKTYPSNAKAALYHPKFQSVTVASVNEDYEGTKIFELKSSDGKRLAPFRAGQYITVSAKIGSTMTVRPYSLSGSPIDAKNGVYTIAVKKDDKGFVSPFIHQDWKVGTKLSISSPEGFFYYEPIRDCKKVIALAGGVGITPFIGMARAIKDGKEDFDLTIVYGSRILDGIIYRKELDELQKACSKVHIVYVLSDEEKAGYEHGFITSDLIKKYGGEEFSVFMCGPQAMYNFLDGEIKKLGLDIKHVRRELYGAIKEPWKQPGYPASAKDKTFKCKVIQCGETKEIEANANESLLIAFEKAGLKAPSRCRSGECGWCRSALRKGEVFVPEVTDGRRAADKEYGYIHPCASFPISDTVVELPAGDNY